MFIFILLIIIFAIVWLMPQDNTPKTCDELGMPHKWIYRKKGGNEYLVCEKCGILPGGHREENNGN